MVRYIKSILQQFFHKNFGVSGNENSKIPITNDDSEQASKNTFQDFKVTLNITIS